MSISLPVRVASFSAIRLPGRESSLRAAASLVATAAAFLICARGAGTVPFERGATALSDGVRAERSLPHDTPLPDRGALLESARGPQLPYLLVWESPLTPAEAGGQIEAALATSERWQMTQFTDLHGEFSTTLARVSADNQMTHFALLSVQDEGGRTVVRFEFKNTNEVPRP